MCGEGVPEEDGCRYVDDEGPSTADSKLPKSEPSPAGNSKGIECVCFYVPESPRTKAQKLHETQKSSPLTSDLLEEWSPAPPGPSAPPTSGYIRDICDLPPYENFAIPYPRPSPSVELRGGRIFSGCMCVKRDGLQHDCPRTGCQGKAPCMAYPAPLCGPSGNAPSPPPSEATKKRGMWPRGGRHQVAPLQRGAAGYHPPDDDDPYVRMGRRGYRENPPVKQQPQVPCEEHRKTRC